MGNALGFLSGVQNAMGNEQIRPQGVKDPLDTVTL